MLAPDDIEPRLRRALAGTSEHPPRPLAQLDLPFTLDELIARGWLEALRPAAVLAPVVRRREGLAMLLTRRADTLRSHQGQISFPGGRRDAADISAADNALREAEEEIGLPRRHVEVLGYLDDYPTHSRYRVTPVVGLVHDLPPLRPDPAEVAETFEVPLPVLLDPARFERKHWVRDGVGVPFYEIHFGAYRIWGATAGMLWDLCRKVNAA